MEATSAAPDSPTMAERLQAFRSIGWNCEFGFVQRYSGIEASGLFRFTFTPIKTLTAAVSSGFERYGAPGDLQICESESGFYYCRSKTYNFWYNTSHKVGTGDTRAILREEYGKVAHLKRKILQELADGSCILVRRAEPDESRAAFAQLAAAIADHGPSTILRVFEADEDHEAGSLERVSDTVLVGRIARFAPQVRAYEIDLEPWLTLCDRAYAAWRGVPELGPAGARENLLSLPDRLRRHRGRRPGGTSLFTEAVDTRALAPDRPYVFSAWVWIPREFEGTRVFANLGHERLGWRDADLSLRECWQRVWAAGRIPRDQPRLRVGLVVTEERKNLIWSSRWRLHEGPVPSDPAQPAPVSARPSLLRWLSPLAA